MNSKIYFLIQVFIWKGLSKKLIHEIGMHGFLNTNIHTTLLVITK
jgi:hypothetical protein